MKYRRMPVLFLLTIIALSLFSCTAGATTITSPSGTQYWGTISGESSYAELEGSFVTIKCSSAVVGWKVESQGGTATASGQVTSLEYWGCNYPVTVLNKGSVQVHKGPLSGTMTGTGQALTFVSTVGDCIVTTNNTTIGTIEGGFPGRFVADGTYSRTGGNFLCGSSVRVMADYKISTPSSLYID